MRKTCDARVEVLANGNPNVINYGFRPAIDAPKIPSKQDFLHDKRDKTSAEATEGRIVGFEAASGYAAIAFGIYMPTMHHRNPETGAALPIEMVLQQAVAQHQAGELAEAERLYQIILATQQHPDALHNFGILALQQGRWCEAGDYLKRALEAKPDVPQYWLSNLEYLLQAGLLPQMAAMLEQVQQAGLTGEVIENLQARLRAAQATGAKYAQWEAEGAAARIEAAVRAELATYGNNPARAHALGKALLLKGQNAEALPWLQQACDGTNNKRTPTLFKMDQTKLKDTHFV